MRWLELQCMSVSAERRARAPRKGQASVLLISANVVKDTSTIAYPS